MTNAGQNWTRRLLAAVMAVSFVTTGLAAVAATPASAVPVEDPPPPPPAYSCPSDEDLQAALDANLGTGHTAGEFVSLWVPRLKGLAEIAPGINLDSFLNRAAGTLPQEVADEGWHGLPLDLKQCLTSKLYAELDAPGGTDDPTFPIEGVTLDTGIALLYGFVFDNQFVHDASATPPPGDPTVVNPPAPVDAVDAILAALRAVEVPTIPTVTIPTAEQAVPLVTKTVDELVGGILNPVQKLFTDLGSIVGGLPLPLDLPIPALPNLNALDLINLGRGVIDSSMYLVCWYGTKDNAKHCSTPVPIGTPVPVDLAGDVRPDFTAQLSPQVNLANPINSVRVQWNLQRVAPALNGIPGPMSGQVWAQWTIPTGDLLVGIGTKGTTPDQLPSRSTYTATLEDVQAAAAGDIRLSTSLVHQNAGPTVTAIALAAPVKRDGTNLGTASTEAYDAAFLDFTPVPAAPAAITANLRFQRLDIDSDSNADQRVTATVNMPQSGIKVGARVRSRLPRSAPAAECCPFRSIDALITSMPTTATVVVDSYPAKRFTEVTYDASSPIDLLEFTSADYPDTDGRFPMGADANTFTEIAALVEDLPTHIHVTFKTPNPASLAKTTAVHYDANAPIPHAEFRSTEVVHDAASNGRALQRRLLFEADTIPSVIDLFATTTKVSDQASTGSVLYAANGSVTNAHLEVLDIVNVSELVADVASIPKVIAASYDVESPTDLNPLNPGCEDPGHTVLHVDGRTAALAPIGSAPFGLLTAKFRSRVDAFLTPDAAIAPEEHTIVNMDPRNPNTCLDDTTQADLRYSGLRALDAEILENGRIAGTIRNDAEKLFVIQVINPAENLTARIDKLPKQISFAKELVGGNDDNMQITYDGCTPGPSDCAPKVIDTLKVRIDGKLPPGSDGLVAGEFVDVTASTVPGHVEVDLDLRETVLDKKVAYDASSDTGRVTAVVRKAVTGMGTMSIAADVTGVPQHFDASFGEERPVVFKAGAGQTIDSIKATLTNTGTAQTPATFSPHVSAKYVEVFGADPILEADIGLANLQSFAFNPGANGSFQATIDTGAPAAGDPNPNSPFTIVADVLLLGTLKDANGVEILDGNGDPIELADLNKASVIRTGPGGTAITPLPTHIVIGKTGGVQPNGFDTSALTIDTTGSVGTFAFTADLGVGGPDGVTDALAEALPAVQGVAVGDGAATGEDDASRLRMYLPATPARTVVRYGQILVEGAPPNNDPAFDVSGFGTIPGDLLTIQIGLDDKPLADRLSAVVKLGGVRPALNFLKFFPIKNVPAAEDGDLDLEVNYQGGANAGPLDLDMGMGSVSGHPGRVEKRIVVHTDVLSPKILFQAQLGAPAAGHLVHFHGEFRDTGGALNSSPSGVTVRYQTPGADNADNPAAKVSLALQDVPSLIDMKVTDNGKKTGANPDETCGIAKSDFILPTISYDSDGLNKNSLNLQGELDLSFIEAGSPKVIFDIVDFADGFTITNTDNGDTFNVGGNTSASSTKVLVKVEPLDITLLDLNWTGCEEGTDLVEWVADGRAVIAVNTKLRLKILDFTNAELKPGFSTGVTSDGTVTLGLPSPTFVVTFSQNFYGAIRFRLSDDIKGDIPVLGAPNGTVSFPLPIVFHVAEQTSGEWFSFTTPIPCVIPGYQLTAVANIKPHRVALSTNQFTVTPGQWTVTADPFGVSAGLSILFGGIDIIDTIAGLFTSPYDHGIQAPSLECEFIF